MVLGCVGAFVGHHFLESMPHTILLCVWMLTLQNSLILIYFYIMKLNFEKVFEC